MGKIFSPGKLLITSEYVVLDGALALAIPTKWGQEFFFECVEDGKSIVHWEALHQGKPWLQAEIDYKAEKIVAANLPESAAFVLNILSEVKRKSATKLQEDASFIIRTNLQFPADFGLGSSSTLMANIAKWAEVDAFELNERCLGGSGYDIAIAQEASALLYQKLATKRNVTQITFHPEYTEDLVFVHLNQKQNSREGIKHYRENNVADELISDFTAITEKIIKVTDLETFSELMEMHEKKLSDFLKLQPVKERYFSDCPVFVKSLGAWGGDFVLTRKFEDYQQYFKKKGFETVFLWKELVG